jgi:LacI family transcriptional regulator
LTPTQYDIAKKAGVSQATASRALRGDLSVVPETRQKILDACLALGYRPSVGARILAEGRRAVIGISLSRNALPTDRYVTLLHQSLLHELAQSGWGVTLLPAESLSDNLNTVGAVILIGVEIDDPRMALCRKQGIPFIAIGYVDRPDVPSVVPDDSGGARLVVNHFHAIGRKRLLMLSSSKATQGPATQRREAAAHAEANRLGIAFDRIDCFDDVTSTLSGYRTIVRASDKLNNYDCLFCDTDEHALGALAALRDLGIKVPEQISVAGFDDLPGMSANLTTIRQEFDLIAREAIGLREEALAGTPARQIVVPVRLMVRKT